MRLQAVSFHAPLKNRKHDDENDGDAVLENLRGRETLPEAVRTQRPVLRIGTEKQEQGEAEKDKRPHLGPWEVFAPREQGENAYQQDEDAGPTMVVLRPCNVGRSIGAEGVRSWDENGRKLTAVGFGTSTEFFGGSVDLLEVWAR